MNQQDIFRLLLLVLLLANRQLSSTDKDSDDDTDTTPFSYTLINDLLIIVMMTQLFCDPDSDTNNTDTTF